MTKNQELKVTESSRIPIILQKNEVIRSSFSMSLPELRVISCALSKLHNMSKAEDGIKITIEDMSLTCQSRDAGYKSMVSAVDSILNRQIVFRTGIHETLKIQWVSAAHYNSEKREIELFFTPMIFPLLINMQAGFTKYRLEKLRYFSSPSAFRLFQIWSSGKNFPREYVIALYDLREMLDLGDLYPKYGEFKSKILKPAMVQCESAGLNVNVLELKEGRKVTKLAFSINEIDTSIIEEESNEKDDEEDQGISLHVRQCRDYAKKMYGSESKYAKYCSRVLRSRGFDSYGCVTNEQEIELLAAWLRNKMNAGKVLDLLELVGYRQRKRL